MDALERIEKTIRLEIPDRVPVVPNTLFFMAKYSGITMEEFLFDNQTDTGAEIKGNAIILHFVDGERGDDLVHVQDGIVVDRGGPGFKRYTGGDDGGGGGCFIESAAFGTREAYRKN